MDAEAIAAGTSADATVLRVDILIVGAGLSGIGASAHLRRSSPWAQLLILEGREALGGTWDLFRYPGVRSDSDMHTMGYAFRPWLRPQVLAPGDMIRDYISDTAQAYRLDPDIRYRHRVTTADWDGGTGLWTLACDTPGGVRRFGARFVVFCTGYYDYDTGHAPHFAGQERFAGTLVHPQFWPPGLDHAGKRVAVIGSGATAVTLLPALARTAAHVVMVQRSPGYIVSRPGQDRVQARLGAWLPGRAAARLTRLLRIGEQMLLYRLARRRPDAVRRHIQALIRARLGPRFDVARHFTPRYAPWDQRICIVPDNDLFDALRDGRASIETGEIAAFESTGLRMADGTHVAADIVVTATGLKLKMMGGIAVRVDGRPVVPARELVYKGMMLSGVPNHAFVVGYTNASWTLKADLVAHFTCRMVNFMRRRGYGEVVAVRSANTGERPLLDLASGYVQRAIDQLPRQGDRAPWRLFQNYLRDRPMFRWQRLQDGVLTFRRTGAGSWR